VAGAAAGEEKPDARLQEAQKAYEEAKVLDEAAQYTAAVARAEQALALREAALGSSHPEVANCLDLLGRLHRILGDFARAESVIQRGLAMREAAFGKNHPDVAASLHNLANLYLVQGMYDRAEPLLERSVSIREAALGKDHPDLAGSLNSLASLYKAQGQYGRAEPLYLRAISIREAVPAKNPSELAKLINNLAMVYADQGMYSRAEPLYQRAIAMREAALGKSHPDLVPPLNNLAILYFSQGLYDRAEPLYLRAIAIEEAVLGKDHPDLAGSLNNLANLYYAQGMYSRAEPLYQRVLAIMESALGENHPELAQALHNLGNVYYSLRLYDRAEPLYLRARTIFEATVGKDHPLVASSSNSLADLYAVQGLYARAEPLYLRAIAMREAALGKHHPDLAGSLHGLANLYKAQGQYGRAEPLYQRALAIWEATRIKNHPEAARLINNFAVLRLAQGRLGAALPLFTRAFAMSEQRLRREALDFSEARLASFLQFLRADEERLYALLRAHPENASARRLALSAALLVKGRSVEETADISRVVYRSLGPEDRGTFERLRGLRTQLASLALQSPGSLSLTAYQQQFEELAKQGDALEASLARRSAPLRALATLPSPADIVGRVAKALPRDGALIEFITYMDRPLVLEASTPEPQHPSQLRYLALVLFPDASIRALDLGPAEPIDSGALRLRAALANRDDTFQAHARALYKAAFQPLLPLLGKTRRLFLSTDGQLALVPFAALHDGERVLVETFDFTYLTSGKSLLPRTEETVPAAAVVVLADPDFNAPLHAPTGEVSVQATRSTSIERFFSTLAQAQEHRAWAAVPLPGTRQEAEAIQRLFSQAQLFLGPEATKERLLNLPPPGILHLATHGFFLEDASTPAGSRAVGKFGALGEDPFAARPPDPLLRSGLLLAGASAPASGASSPSHPPPESAVVTALELAGLNLWGTQLVVLSACDTGRGDVKLGQGVYGLRRAFVVAGAETVVMSLWKVKDDTTQQLMEAYYRNLLAGQGRATALREAMRWLRATRPHPHYWAPFIALGRDAPLAQPAR
jgi:CHAT domain-containing protein/tetratricopeptide (TPR) repeat protein